MKKAKRKSMRTVVILIVIALPIAVWIGSRMNWAVRSYSFHPDLPAPGVSMDFKYDDVFADLYIRWCNFYDHLLTESWRAPDSVVKKSLSVTARDGYQIGGYILEPEGCEGEVLPTMLYCHGGAFFLTMMNCQLDLGAIYAEQLHCRVILPEYRTSLDHPYPVPVYDCFDVLQWIAKSEETDTGHVMIYGDSAGGCLAALVTQMCMDEKLLLPCSQMLIYPVTDTSQDYPSLTTYENTTWTREGNLRMWKLFLRGKEPAEGDYAVPMLREDFEGFPRTYVEVAEMDTLYDQGLAYAEKMQNGGVDVSTVTAEGAYHGFDGPTENSYVQEMLWGRISWLKEALEESV